jgi:predicted protein tyrosine phosphatase
MVLVVTPLRLLPQVLAERAPSHLITLLSPAELIDTPAGFDPRRHLRLGVHDIEFSEPGFVVPDARMVEQVLAFAQDWDARAPMVVHCWAGISRSTASAFAIACARNPQADELGIALAMRRASSSAFPNRRIVALADDILDRRGRMLEAVEAMGGNGFATEGVPFDLAARH